MPEVESGKKTMKQAMIEAGYAESTADQQQQVLGSLRINTKMQEALKKAGFTEDYLATGIVEGTKAKGSGPTGDLPDYRARGIFYKLGAELMDAFPAEKSIQAQVGIESLLDAQESAADYAVPRQ